MVRTAGSLHDWFRPDYFQPTLQQRHLKVEVVRWAFAAAPPLEKGFLADVLASTSSELPLNTYLTRYLTAATTLSDDDERTGIG
eukprot:CAMPEP_0185751378 /NCGR_PEP_ID=MMETSP1174-20130828/10154_1 /TAXON_ID=35687 /ORGANISM="Dictyocha speculum, Strain CCMP1381" /LENGTH=83 /DNA_ID=CAMNT_0028428327 /DNA_START=855 /DNA_END=1107 /DNA_ORIENTATION=-